MKHEKDTRINAVFTMAKFHFFLISTFGLFNIFLDRIYMFFFKNDIQISHLGIRASRLIFTIMFTAVLTIAVASVGYFLLMRPLKELGEAAKKIAKGDFSVRIARRRKNGKKDFVDVLFDDFNSMTEELASANEKLKALSITDELTKLNNRRSFLEYMDLIWKQNQRLKLPVNILMIDIDYFKKYNDSLGHLEGDKTLIAVAQCLKDNVKRETDFVARFGGEEFVCLLPFIEKNEAMDFAKALVQSVENMKISHPMSEVSKYVTVSVGMASAVPNEDCMQTELLDEADKALYAAKEAGRNRVIMN